MGSNLINLIDNIEILKHEASKLNISLTDYAIQEVLKNKNILSIITGIKNKDQLTDNLNSLI